MMTSAFAPHPGGIQHPGMAHGQPMGPGQVAHPGQPIGQPMMHPGVSAAAGPHMAQAGQMMGLQPGMVIQAGPGAHAMSHLAPNAQMMPPQAMANNPMMQRQMQQQQHMQQAMFQQRMQQMQQIQQQNSVPMGMNVMGAGLSPQQIAAMRAGGAPVNLPPHMQMQQAYAQSQAMQMQAAQQAAAAQAQQQHQQQQQQQQQQQTMAGQQHHLAMQHVTSQGSNQGQPNLQNQPGGPQSGPPNRPPTSMGGAQKAQPAPAQPQEPQQGPQQGPQQSQAPQQAPTSTPQPQTSQAPAVPAQNQQAVQHAAQQASQGPQPGHPAQAQPVPQQQVQAVPNQQAQAHQQVQALKNQAQAAQAQNAARHFMQQRQAVPQGMSGAILLKIFNFADKLGQFRISDGRHNDISFWKSFINQHFTDDGIFRMILRPMTQGEKAAAKTFDVGAPSLPRYFWTQYDSQVDQIQILLDGLLETNLPDNYHSVKAARARMIYWFKDGTQLVWNGALTALYMGEKIENLTFETREHQQFIPRSRLEELCAQASPDQNKSPRMTKKANPRNQQRQQQPAQPSFDRRMLPPSPVNEMGVTPRIQNFLEISETVFFMKDLMYFAQDNPKLSVPDAMNALVQNYKANQQQNMAGQMNPMQQHFMQPQHAVHGQMNLPPGAQANPAIHQMQQGVRTPNAPGMQGQFMSPAMQNSILPGPNQAHGSPHASQNPIINSSLQGNTHTPSPAQSHMAPPMVPQQSQGNASGPSAGTSPSTSNKRRRSTQIGVKEEDTGSQPNGTQAGGAKVKQSPRMSSNTAKRLKGS